MTSCSSVEALLYWTTFALFLLYGTVRLQSFATGYFFLSLLIFHPSYHPLSVGGIL